MAVLPYLASSCPGELQQTACSVLQSLAEFGESDAVWLMLCQTCESEWIPESEKLQSYPHREVIKTPFVNMGCLASDIKPNAVAIYSSLQ